MTISALKKGGGYALAAVVAVALHAAVAAAVYFTLTGLAGQPPEIAGGAAVMALVALSFAAMLLPLPRGKAR